MTESQDRGKTRRTWLAVVLAFLAIPPGIGIDTLLRAETIPWYEALAKVGLAAAWVVMVARLAWRLPALHSRRPRRENSI
jgi:hypothetical protein